MPRKDVAEREAYDGSGRRGPVQEAFDRDSHRRPWSPLDSTVHYGTRYSNALGRRQMIYGDGDGRTSSGSRDASTSSDTSDSWRHAVHARLVYKIIGSPERHFSDVSV